MDAPTLRGGKPPTPNAAAPASCPCCPGPCRPPRPPAGPPQARSKGCPRARGARERAPAQPHFLALVWGQQLSFAGRSAFSSVYHANFSRDNFSTMSPPARTEPLYGAGPREAAALPRRTKAHCSTNMPAPLRPESAERAASGPAERTPGPPPPGARSSHPSRREGGAAEGSRSRVGR